MAIVDIVMPKLGESIMEATILKWHKKPGDAVANDETILDIATDKVDSEVPSTASGVIAELLYKENDVVPIGAPIVRIDTDPKSEAATTASAAAKPASDEPEEDIQIPYAPQPKPMLPMASGAINRFYSPLVLTIANSEGISMLELESIPGSGSENRVNKNDILAYLENKKTGTLLAGTNNGKPQLQSTQPAQSTPVKTETQQTAQSPVTTENKRAEEPAKTYSGNVEVIEMDRMRKLIAKHMVDSKQTSPHVTSFAEADVTNMLLWRNRIKNEFEKREGIKITFTPLFIECIVKAIKKYPIVNSSVDGDNIILKKDINIGMATALPGGNLIVPVIRNADYMNLIGLTKSVNTLAVNARNGKLKPDDTKEGTFTFTNVGTFGSLMGTPIINQPQVAILSVGIIKKRPVVIETEQGDTLGIRHMMYLSLSYDHRIVDGSAGSSFLAEVAREIESWDEKRSLL